MRAIAVGAMVGAAAMFAAAPAGARIRAVAGGLSTTGSVSITWHGDVSRGCADAGLCGYRGSASTQPGLDGQLYLVLGTLGTHGVADAFGYLQQDTTSVVRVLRRETSGAVDACVDASPPTEVDVTVRGVRQRTARIGLAGGDLGIGRCAGPDLTNALLSIPARRVSMARLRRGGITVDMKARVPFRSGRFSGRLVSTVRLHVGRMRSSRSVLVFDESGAPRRKLPLARVVELHAVYRVAGLAGKLATSFQGLAAPACNGVDACGVSGAANWAILSSGGTITLDSAALAGPSDHGLRGLVAAVRRHGSRGYIAASVDLRHEVGTTSARTDRDGGASCHDSRSVLPPFVYTPSSRTVVRFVVGSPVVFPQGPDVLRTGCPGPTRAGVVGLQPVASGRFALAAVARRRIDVPLRAGGRFDDGAYRGAWRSRFTLRLVRVEKRLTYRLRPVAR
jgi:hypothetical protein